MAKPPKLYGNERLYGNVHSVRPGDKVRVGNGDNAWYVVKVWNNGDVRVKKIGRANDYKTYPYTRLVYMGHNPLQAIGR